MKPNHITYHTEDNRLQGVQDNNIGAYYGYDSQGERGLKLTGPTIQVNINGYTYQVSALKEQTLYASPLITINDKGYTKHYFEEGKRICSKIGSGGLIEVGNIIEGISQGIEEIRDIQRVGVVKTFDICMQLHPYIKTNNLHKTVVKPYEGQINPDEPIFYYHSDHLGSASFLTDRDGYETQQLVYLPFGELRSNREYNNINNKYHEQTGYNNYGARYYYDWASIWLSVDPMSDKYPHVTNYIYCSNNPVMVVDPDGRDEWEVNAAGQIKHINDTPESKKHDAFYIVDENGNRVENKFLEFNKGTVTNYSRDESKNRDIFEIKGDENAKQVFELMAGNTNKEWTHAKVGTKKSGRNVLGTDHSKSSTGIAGYLLNTGWTLREVNHNHPSGRATPSWEQKEGGNIDESRGDVPIAKHYENKFPNIKLNVYTTEHKYSPYDSFGTKDERILTGKIR